MDDDQQFCLRWNNHQSTLISVFDTLLENETLVDCTLAAEGKFLKAHKVVLSACSPYFATLLQEQYDKHPIFILKDVKYQELRAMMDYMYRGEVNISQDQLAALLKAAESLQIKGLSDNRSGGGVPKHDPPQQQQHRGLGLASGAGVGLGGVGGGKHGAGGGYTLEQTKRARMGPASIDSQELSGSREGSSSPTTRRRRKVRRRSIDNTMSDVHHDNSNSSQIQSIATTSSLLQQQQTNASLGGVGAIAAAASALASQVPPSVAAALPTTAVAAAASSIGTAGTAIQSGTTQQQMTGAAAAAAVAATTSVTKKTESVKGSSGASGGSDVLHSELLASIDEQQQQQQHQHAAGLVELKTEKQNHKQQKSVLGKDASAAGSSVTSTELVIEPKSEYDDEGNEENVEDLTLDDEDMGMEDLDHNAGTSHGNEGSSQGYAQWQHDRSQDEVFMATQEAQQRDPQDFTGDVFDGVIELDKEYKKRFRNKKKSNKEIAKPPPPTTTTTMKATIEQNLDRNTEDNLKKIDEDEHCSDRHSDDIQQVISQDQSENRAIDEDDHSNYQHRHRNNLNDCREQPQYDDSHKLPHDQTEVYNEDRRDQQPDDHPNQSNDCINHSDDHHDDQTEDFNNDCDSDQQQNYVCHNQTIVDDHSEEYRDHSAPDDPYKQLDENLEDHQQQQQQPQPQRQCTNYYDHESYEQSNDLAISLRQIEDTAAIDDDDNDDIVEIIDNDHDDQQVNYYTVHILDSMTAEKGAAAVAAAAPLEPQTTTVAEDQISFCEIEENDDDDDDGDGDGDRYNYLNRVDEWDSDNFAQRERGRDRDRGNVGDCDRDNDANCDRDRDNDDTDGDRDRDSNGDGDHDRDDAARMSIVNAHDEDDNDGDVCDDNYQELLLPTMDTDLFMEIDDDKIDLSSSRQEQQLIEPTAVIANAATTIMRPERRAHKEIITYQRFGRSDRHQAVGCSFKCHLCGFSCSFKQTLLQHFRQIHPT